MARGERPAQCTYDMAALTPSFFALILKIEGGYQAMPDDAGNYCAGNLIGTKYGVSAVAFSAWAGRCPTVAEMKALTTDTAFNFYSWYFHYYNLYPIESQKLFELCANNTMGSPANAARVEQKVLNQLGYSVTVDGVRGPATIAALNDAWRKNPATLYNGIRATWIEYLKSLNKPQFLPGWLTRLEYFPPIGTAIGAGAALAILALLITFIKK